ncbi:hypothetical protein [Granulicatella balaenopterae]|uniref:hypothetical protein n=1 Tax=Granulicatella balaenopterae TaxID=137733 RepID=UPI0015A6AE98|nr:hypothetical protein [Granulicatella balaenopterae]
MSNKDRGAWWTFLIGIGLFIVATSQMTPNSYASIITGLTCVLVGVYQLKKNKK